MVARAKIHIPTGIVTLREQATTDLVWIGPVLANQDIHHGPAHDRRVLPLGARDEDGQAYLYDTVIASLTEQVASEKYRPALMLRSHPEDYPADVQAVLAALEEGAACGIIVAVRDVHRSQAAALGIPDQKVERGTYLGVRLSELGRRIYDMGAMPYQSVYVSGPFTDDEGRVWPAWLHEASIVPEPRFKFNLPSDELRGVQLREVDDEQLATLLDAFAGFAASLAPEEPEQDPEADAEPAPEPETDESAADDETDDDDMEVKMSERNKGGAKADTPDLSVKLAEKEAEVSDLRVKLGEAEAEQTRLSTKLAEATAKNEQLEGRMTAVEAVLAERDRNDAIAEVVTEVEDLGGVVTDIERDILRSQHGTELFGKFAENLKEQAAKRAPEVTTRTSKQGSGSLAPNIAKLEERALQIRHLGGRDDRGLYKISLDDARQQAREGK